MNSTRQKRIARHARVRAKIKGNAQRPRLSVFRSNAHLYVQIIDDAEGKTLASASDQEVKVSEKGKVSKALAVGKLIAQKAKEKKISKVVFDRGGYQYHGRVKAVADGAREGGLVF